MTGLPDELRLVFHHREALNLSDASGDRVQIVLCNRLRSGQFDVESSSTNKLRGDKSLEGMGRVHSLCHVVVANPEVR